MAHRGASTDEETAESGKPTVEAIRKVEAEAEDDARGNDFDGASLDGSDGREVSFPPFVSFRHLLIVQRISYHQPIDLWNLSGAG